MGKFQGVLICTDCDGTLTDANGELSEENAKAIQYFQKEGGRFTLATGRFPEHVYKYADKLKVNAPVISLNGVMVYDLEEKRVLCDFSMETESARQVLAYLDEHWKGIWEYWLNFSGTEAICYKPAEEAGSILTKKLPDKIAKIVLIMPEDMLRPVQKDLRKMFGNQFYFDSSWPNGLEMQWNKSSKGIGVEKLKEYLGDIQLTVCVGDYDNDISMLKIADISYAVGNAIEEVKANAMRITVTNNESAIAEIIKDLESERLQNNHW